MSVASTLRGLTQIDLSTLATPEPTDPFAAAYPTFKTFTPTGATIPRDEVVLLRRSVATAPTARQPGTMAGGLAAFDENDVPSVLRALNPANDATERGFPRFTYGRAEPEPALHERRPARARVPARCRPGCHVRVRRPHRGRGGVRRSARLPALQGFCVGRPAVRLLLRPDAPGHAAPTGDPEPSDGRTK